MGGGSRKVSISVNLGRVKYSGLQLIQLVLTWQQEAPCPSSAPFSMGLEPLEYLLAPLMRMTDSIL